MANAVYRRIFDDVFVMTSAEKSIRRDVFAFCILEKIELILLYITCKTACKYKLTGAFSANQKPRLDYAYRCISANQKL